jgi:hypothetical protein
MKDIRAVAKVIRSKNCSPFELTMDLIIKDKVDYLKIKDANLINVKLIADLYGISQEKISKVVYFDPANAIKITMQRLIPSSSPGDADVYGAQQHGPLLDIKLDI